MEWTLRPATAGDRAFLYALHRETMQEYVGAIWGWDENVQQALFDDAFEPNTYSVVVIAGRDVGMLRIIDRADALWLSNIELLPAYQKRGIGSALVDHVLALGEQQGKRVALRVLKNNPARRLYERLGFEVLAETETHYEMDSQSHEKKV